MRTTIKCLLTAIVMSLLMSTALMAGDWTPIYDGIWYQTATKTSPRKMHAYALRIDLKNPNVSFYATGSNGGNPYETNLKTTPEFRSNNGLEAAINANFFVPSGSYANVRGCLISNGSTVSPHEGAFPAQLRITAAKYATILNGSGTPSGQHTVVSGDAWHLTNGGAYGANDIVRARTSVGISQDGRFLIWCVVDEGQSDSQGATILDMSHWMKDFGAWNAMNLDGGGSSCICTASGGVLNHPSDGSPRSVGANLGTNTSAYDPRQNVFWRGNDNNIRTKKHLASTGWQGVTNIGAPPGGATSDPSAVSRMPGIMWVFVRGGNGHLYYKWSNESGWASSWTDLGGDIVGSPDACSWNYDRVDVFARSTSDTMLQLTWKEDTGWGSWYDRGGTITSDPSAVSWGPGRIDVFARNGSGSITQNTCIDGTGWGSWVNHSGHVLVGGPEAVSRTTGRIVLFWRTTDNTLRTKYYNGAWSSAESLGGTLYGDPGACSRDPGYLAVFVHGSGDKIHSRNWQESSGTWSSWYDQGETVQGGVDACSWTNDAGTHQ